MTTTRTEHDPICHMDIDPATAAGRSEYEGNSFYFCSRGCKLDFDEDPAAALKVEAEHDHSQPVHQMMTMHHEADPPKKPWWRFW